MSSPSCNCLDSLLPDRTSLSEVLLPSIFLWNPHFLLLKTLLTKFCFNNGYLCAYPSPMTNSLRVRQYPSHFLIHRSLSSASFTISWSGNFLNDVLYALINGAWVEIMFWIIIITNTFYQAPWNCFSHSLGRLSFTRLA